MIITVPSAPEGASRGGPLPPADMIDAQARAALEEDLGPGDLTAILLPEHRYASAELSVREPAVLCGQAWFEAVYRCLDANMSIHWFARDGDRLSAGQLVCRLHGELRALLSGERTALNYLQTLSGTATEARRHADLVADLPTRLLDTRKTLPGLRIQQKYAVRCGGCENHRLGLYDAVLIKENHILAAGSIAAAVAAARRVVGDREIQVEVERLTELEQALAAGVKRVLLDNFDLPTLREAVVRTAGRARLEASGGIGLENLRAVAETGVDDISLGALTKHLRAIDLSLRLV